MINFSQVPNALRQPGVYIEIDGSQAGLGGDIPAVLLVGQKLAAGAAPAGTVTRVASVQDAINKFGAGSMLATMAARYRAADGALDLYALPYADNAAGVAATGTLTVSAAPTANGTLALYLAGTLVSVGVTAGQTAAQVAAAIQAAITAAGSAVPVTATVTGAAVTLTALHKGSCGNGIDLRLNLYGEQTPAGLTLTLAAMSGGAGDPAPGDLPGMLGAFWYRYVALGMADAATLAAWHTESQRRYAVPIQAGMRIFTAFRGDYATAAAFGVTKNYEHICCLSAELNPNAPWEFAATLAAVAGPALFNNPVKSLEGLKLPGMAGVSNHDLTASNSLLFKGMSVMEIDRAGGVYVKRLISMYQTRSDGSADDAYLDINVAEVMERIRYEQRMGAIKAFRGTVAAKSAEGFKAGLPITTVDGVRGFLLSTYRNLLMAEYGWVQNYEYYKSTLVVEQDPANPNRFNFLDDPVINSPFYILAGRAMFRRAAPN